MHISALLQPLTIRGVRAKLVQDISVTVQAFALLGLVFSVVGIAVAPQLRVTMEFCLLGVCLVSAVVLLTNELRHEAGTAVWFGAVVSGLISCDLADVIGKILMIVFLFVCLRLMWYVTPTPKPEPE